MPPTTATPSPTRRRPSAPREGETATSASSGEARALLGQLDFEQGRDWLTPNAASHRLAPPEDDRHADSKQFALQRELVAPATPPARRRALALQVARLGSRIPLPHAALVRDELGVDPADLEVFGGPEAELACRAVDAEAFTVGRVIVLMGSASAETVRHEVEHALQQGLADPGAPETLAETADHDAAEKDARRAETGPEKPTPGAAETEEQPGAEPSDVGGANADPDVSDGDGDDDGDAPAGEYVRLSRRRHRYGVKLSRRRRGAPSDKPAQADTPKPAAPAATKLAAPDRAVDEAVAQVGEVRGALAALATCGDVDGMVYPLSWRSTLYFHHKMQRFLAGKVPSWLARSARIGKIPADYAPIQAALAKLHRVAFKGSGEALSASDLTLLGRYVTILEELRAKLETTYTVTEGRGRRRRRVTRKRIRSRVAKPLTEEQEERAAASRRVRRRLRWRQRRDALRVPLRVRQAFWRLRPKGGVGALRGRMDAMTRDAKATLQATATFAKFARSLPKLTPDAARRVAIEWQKLLVETPAGPALHLVRRLHAQVLAKVRRSFGKTMAAMGDVEHRAASTYHRRTTDHATRTRKGRTSYNWTGHSHDYGAIDFWAPAGKDIQVAFRNAIVLDEVPKAPGLASKPFGSVAFQSGKVRRVYRTNALWDQANKLAKGLRFRGGKLIGLGDPLRLFAGLKMRHTSTETLGATANDPELRRILARMRARFRSVERSMLPGRVEELVRAAQGHRTVRAAGWRVKKLSAAMKAAHTGTMAGILATIRSGQRLSAGAIGSALRPYYGASTRGVARTLARFGRRVHRLRQTVDGTVDARHGALSGSGDWMRMMSSLGWSRSQANRLKGLLGRIGADAARLYELLNSRKNRTRPDLCNSVWLQLAYGGPSYDAILRVYLTHMVSLDDGIASAAGSSFKVGRVGTTGNSGTPHLHVGADLGLKPSDGDGERHWVPVSPLAVLAGRPSGSGEGSPERDGKS